MVIKPQYIYVYVEEVSIRPKRQYYIWVCTRQYWIYLPISINIPEKYRISFSGIKYFSFKIFICKLEYIGYYDVHLKYRETYLELTYQTLS